MSTLREVKRLAVCGLISKDEYVIKGFTQELDRMMKAASISEREIVEAINSLIDLPLKDSAGNPRFVTTSHIRSRVEYGREMDARNKSDEEYQADRKSWVRDATGIPECWGVQMDYLSIGNPTEEDKQRVLDSIREEMMRHPKGSELYGLWMTAGKTWKEVRIGG